MLAPDEEDRSIAAMRFSLASDIVELVVLTGDDLFLQTLREAVGASRRLWHVPSSDKVSDLLVAGGVGILVLDAQALNESAGPFIAQIKGQFPDLVVVVAGSRESEAALAHAISDGTVYRFIHKPMSPGRARLFADAAVRRYIEQRGPAASAAAAAKSNHGLLIGGSCAALCVLLGGAWMLRHGAHEAHNSQRSAEAAAPAEAPAIAPVAGAADAVPADHPAAAGARAGPAEVREQLLARAESALLEERWDEASIAIAAARKAGAQGGRIALLSAQLAGAREQLRAPRSQARDSEPGPAAAAPAERQAPAAQQAPPADQPALAPRQQQAAAVGYSPPEQEEARRDPDPAAARQSFLSNVVEASGLTLLTSVQPVYPVDALKNSTQGSVELEFTVAETGEVRDISVRTAYPPGVFETAAINALSQWRYQPVLRGGAPAAQRAHLRIRFAMGR